MVSLLFKKWTHRPPLRSVLPRECTPSYAPDSNAECCVMLILLCIPSYAPDSNTECCVMLILLCIRNRIFPLLFSQYLRQDSLLCNLQMHLICKVTQLYYVYLATPLTVTQSAVSCLYCQVYLATPLTVTQSVVSYAYIAIYT